MWGQTIDYSGTYYIASYAKEPNKDKYYYNPADPTNQDNYYLCPSDGWIYYKAGNNWTADKASSDGPFLTTFKCRTTAYNDYGGMNNAKWVVTKHGDYYAFYHTGTSKYMVLSGKISGCGDDRMRVHLETISGDLPDNALFTIAPQSHGLIIAPKTITGDRLTVNGGNKNSLIGEPGKTGGPKGTGYNYENTAGIVGIYRSTGTDDNRYFYLEDYITRPTITYDEDADEIVITASQEGATLIYTTDGTTPTENNGTPVASTTKTITLTSTTDITTIKAVAKVGNELSNVATFFTPVLIGSSHKYLIQSQNNAWNTTDFHFYMIPGDEENSVIKLNTTSLFRPTMEWYFLNAGITNGVQFYYIVNNSAKDNSDNPYYLCWDGTNVCMLPYISSDANKFKFSIAESPTAGTFNILPYGETKKFINKGGNNGNAAADVIGLRTESSTYSNNANARWKFIVSSALDKTPPFTACDASTHITKFYKIESIGSSGYYIIPPTGNNTNATTSNSATDADIKRGSWYFEEAQAATALDWCTYYHIRNAETGKYLYFTKDANNAGACLILKDDIESGNEERYLFTWARTATTDAYYIIPKLLKDASQNQFSTLQRNSGTLQSNLTRSAGSYAWKFVDAALFCNNPTFSASGGNIVMKCIPGSAEIRYTTNGDDPTTSTYSTYSPATPLSASDQHLIKAYAVVSDGATPTPNTANSPGVVTLFNKPDIVIKEGENVVNADTYTYDKTAKEPTVDEVSITIGGTKYIATPATIYNVTYNNNTDAGTATVNIEDAVESDTWGFLNASKTFTIKQKNVTATADNLTKGYGDADPELTVTVDGLIEGDAITYTISRAAGENVDTYTITLTGETSQGNYNVTSFTNGSFTITQKALNKDDVGTPADGITITVTKNAGPPATYDVTVTHDILGTPTPLVLNTDYTCSGETSTSGYLVTVTAAVGGNYTGFIKATYADPTFYLDGAAWSPSGSEYAAVFLSLSDMVPNPSTGIVIKAYIVKQVNPTIGTITVSPVEYTSNAATNPPTKANYIPEGVPVLLLSNNVNSLGFTTSSPPEDTSDITTTAKNSNKLMVSPEGGVHVEDAEAYIFYRGEFVLTKEGTIAKDKFFIYNPNYKSSPTPPSSPVRKLQIIIEEEEDPDGISEEIRVKSEEFTATESWHTLDGRKLSGKPTRKGLYIMNGKKVVIRR